MKDTPHDKLFMWAFGNPHNAAAEIRCVAPPALVAQMDFASLTPVPGSFRDVVLADSSSDLLFSLRIAGRNALVYVLFERCCSLHRAPAWWRAERDGARLRWLRFPWPRPRTFQRGAHSTPGTRGRASWISRM